MPPEHGAKQEISLDHSPAPKNSVARALFAGRKPLMLIQEHSEEEPKQQPNCETVNMETEIQALKRCLWRGKPSWRTHYDDWL